MFRRHRPSPGHLRPVSGPVPSGLPRPPREDIQVTFPSPAPQQSSRASLRSAAKRMRHRNRHGLRPWLVLLALPALAALAHNTGNGTTGCEVMAMFAVSGITVAWRRYPVAGKRKKKGSLSRFCVMTAALLAVAAWFTWAALTGVTRHALLVLLIAWLVPALAHWNRYRTRHSHDRKAEEVPELPEPEPDVLLERLQTRICGPDGSAAGATIAELPSPVTGARQFLFTGRPGKHTSSTFTSARAAIASAAETPLGRVITERAPGDDGDDGPEHQAMVTILDPQHPQKEIQEFDGPTFDLGSGLFDVGPYPDGEMAHARLLKVDEHGNPIRAASGLTAGAPGSGKSRYAEHKIMEHLASGLFQVVYLDGQGGASIPSLTDHVGWPALRHEEWVLAMRALGRLMVARTRLIGFKRLSHWDPELGPFVQVPMEEAQKPLLDPTVLRITKHLLQEGEKVGIGVDTSTQFPSQIELGGASGTTGANVLREMAASGNVTLFRTSGEFAKNVTVGGVTVGPRDLPRLPGMCYPFGASMREAPVRAIRAADPASWAPIFRSMPFTKFDIAAMDGGEDVYSARMERISAQLADPTEGTLDMAGLEAEVALMLGETAPGKDAPKPGKVTAVQRVWDIIRDKGPIRRADILDALANEYGASSVDKALAALEGQGAIRKGAGKQDPWERVPPRLAAVSE